AARSPGFWLVAAGLLHFLGADLADAMAILRDLPATTVGDSVRLLGFLLLGAAPFHPSIGGLTHDVDPERARLSRPRLLALWFASVTTPLTLLVRAGFGHGAEPIVVAAGSVVLFTLVVARMWGLLGTSTRLLRREHENRFRALVEHAEDVIALLDDQGQVTYVSTSVRRAFGYDPEHVIERGGLVLAPETAERMRRAVRGLTTRGPQRPVRVEGRVLHADGGWRNTEAVLVDRRDDPAIGGIVITVRDVTAQWELEQQLTHQAFHDALTKLPNRALFVDRARQALDVRRDDGSASAVLFLDLDDFKTVNDSLGHEQGDALLQAVAGRLSEVVRGEDTVARLGGDEFAILVPRAADPRIVVGLAERVLSAVSAPLTLAGRRLSPNASVGIAVGDGQTSVDELLRDADAAMYVAKRQGKGTFRVFDPQMHAHAM
ncbi:MAG: sensor domain-containing diguanylate cyclase, partial [Ilumatobacteraceae bacterium]